MSLDSLSQSHTGQETDYLNSTVDDGLDDEFLDEFTDMPMIPDSLTDSNNLEVTLQLKDFIRGLNDLYGGMPQLNDADETTDMHSIRHGIALGTDLYLCESLGTDLAHWSPQQILEFHRCAEIILSDYCPKGKFAKWIILPRFRACFDMRKYAKALVAAQLDDQELWGLIVGDVNRVNGMSCISDLAIAVYHELQTRGKVEQPLDNDNDKVWEKEYVNDQLRKGKEKEENDEDEKGMTLLEAPFNSICVELFRSVAKLAAGHHPNLFAHLFASFIAHFKTTMDAGVFFRECYPISTTYETNHGDLALMLEDLIAIPDSSITHSNIANFVSVAFIAYPSSFAYEIYVYLKSNHPLVHTTVPLSPDPLTSMYKLNAIRHGSSPLFVNMAFDKLPRQLAATAVTIFRYTYERSLKALGRYVSSWRMNDFKTFDHPREALVKITNQMLACPPVVAALQKRTIGGREDSNDEIVAYTNLQLDDDSELTSALYETCLNGALDFGFVEANDIDETEKNIEARWNDGDNETEIDYQLSDGERGGESDEVDQLPSIATLPTKFTISELPERQQYAESIGDFDEPNESIDEAIFDACVQRLDKAGGRAEDVNVDELVDELFFK